MSDEALATPVVFSSSSISGFGLEDLDNVSIVDDA